MPQILKLYLLVHTNNELCSQGFQQLLHYNYKHTYILTVVTECITTLHLRIGKRVAKLPQSYRREIALQGGSVLAKSRMRHSADTRPIGLLNHYDVINPQSY